MDIRTGQTYTLKHRRGRALLSTSTAMVTDITSKGRGHTVHFKSGRKAQTLSLRKFQARAA